MSDMTELVARYHPGAVILTGGRSLEEDSGPLMVSRTLTEVDDGTFWVDKPAKPTKPLRGTTHLWCSLDAPYTSPRCQSVSGIIVGTMDLTPIWLSGVYEVEASYDSPRKSGTRQHYAYWSGSEWRYHRLGDRMQAEAVRVIAPIQVNEPREYPHGTVAVIQDSLVVREGEHWFPFAEKWLRGFREPFRPNVLYRPPDIRMIGRFIQGPERLEPKLKIGTHRVRSQFEGVPDAYLYWDGSAWSTAKGSSALHDYPHTSVAFIGDDPTE